MGYVKQRAIPLPRAEREEDVADEDEEREVLGKLVLVRQVFDRRHEDLKSKNLKREVYF